MDRGRFEITRSNQTEQLVEALFEDLSVPLSSPFQKELILVQGQGMATWLNLQLSRRGGVWANAEYLYPRRFTERLFEWVLGAAASADAPLQASRERYSPESLTWAVATLLPKHFADPAFAGIQRYVGSNIDERRLFSLARKIAETYDEYLTYRPELIRLWSKSERHFDEPQLALFGESPEVDPAVWQRKLWRAVEALLGGEHNAALERRCVQALARRKELPELPERVSVFGLASLPPMYLRLLLELSRRTSVRLYLPSPCAEYFEDILDDKRLRRSGGAALLAALGTQVAEFDKMLRETAEELSISAVERSFHQSAAQAGISGETESEQSRGDSRLLHQLQDQVLSFTTPSRTPTAETASEQRSGAVAASGKADDSIRLHSCHSPVREVEVLHDQVLAWVHREGYAPEEILVLLPDVESYAPLIDAVFRRTDERFLPYRIADRHVEAESAVVRAFLRILELGVSRVTAAQVLDLVALPPVHERFEIESSELAQINDWVAQANITWGIDDAHRESEVRSPDAEVRADSEDSPAPASPKGFGSQNTWRAGLDRLLMGYLADTQGLALVHELAPGEQIEGKAALSLGNFARFVRTLVEHLVLLRTPKRIEEWQESLAQLLSDMICVPQADYWQLQSVLDTLATVRLHAQRAGFESPVHVDTLREALLANLEQAAGARGFLAGGITFSALVPMRTVPFRVVCVLGMNDGAFPREAFRPDFSLLETGEGKRRLGDPNRQKDDRNLFLEALCAARERFYVSFVGQSVRDNSARSPSIVVTQLLEALSELAGPELTSHLLVRHPLQPFSPRYFNATDAALFSYAAEFVPRHVAPAAHVDATSPEAEAGADVFFPGPLSQLERSSEVALSELLSFFRAPTRFLLEQRLGVRPRDEFRELDEHDPIALDGLAAYSVGNELLRALFAGLSAPEGYALSAGKGVLPPGQLGRFAYVQQETVACWIDELAQGLTVGAKPTQLPIRLRLNDQTLEGVVRNIYGSMRVSVQFARLSGRSVVQAWIEHLAWSLQAEALGLKASMSWLIGRRDEDSEPQVVVWRNESRPGVYREYLTTLLQVFDLGCQAPIPLFPDISYAYQQRQLDPKKKDVAFENEWVRQLEQDVTLRRVYGQHSRLTPHRPMLQHLGARVPTFHELTQKVYEPLISHWERPGFRDLLSAAGGSRGDV